MKLGCRKDGFVISEFGCEGSSRCGKMHNARASFIKGTAVQQAEIAFARSMHRRFWGRECARVSERATCTRRTNNRPCKDGRHEILAGCRRREGGSIFFFSSSSSSSQWSHVVVLGLTCQARVLPLPPTPPPPSSSCGAVGLSHAAHKGTIPVHRVLAGRGPLQCRGRGSRLGYNNVHVQNKQRGQRCLPSND